MLTIGTRIRAKDTPLIDDDGDGQERRTSPGDRGIVTSIDDYPGQGPTYGVVFENNGPWVFLLEEELDLIEGSERGCCTKPQS